MCGIAGFLDLSRNSSIDDLLATATQMADSIRHRGPDDCGAWADADAGIALGHRRLSIVDLSPEGRQPMVSECGRYIIVFNGEVYNFGELRAELDGRGATRRWRGHSDTEVMLAAISAWGVEAAAKRFNGMFAFALWDRQERRLHLVRDRLGKKPLYYGWTGRILLFGSELKALRAHPAFDAEIDRDALALYFRHNYIPAPYSIYRGVRKLPPGTWLTIDEGPPGSAPAPVAYWSAAGAIGSSTSNRFDGTPEEGLAELDRLLRDAVRLRMVADVPLGAFLSGGIDSSLVVALMQAQSDRPVRSFTIGFRETDFNEAADARLVAQHLGTEHTELYVTPEETMAVIPRLPELFDEPFSDSSQVPTHVVSQMARRHVTVSLSGDGGDELFGGYNRYFWGTGIWRRVGWMPSSLRRVAAAGLTSLTPEGWASVFGRLGPFLPAGARQRNPGDKLHKLAEILAVDGPDSMYLGLVSHWKDPSAIVLGAKEPPTPLTDGHARPELAALAEVMMYLDLITYLPDDILVKVDRASMGVSLETRAPLLDYRVAEFAWRLPLHMKIAGNQGKGALRQLLYRYVPRELIERPKMGFGVPIDLWLRGPLREWAEGLLGESRMRQEGVLNPGPIREKWAEHLSGRRNWQYYLWDVLMFQAWLDEWGTGKA